MGAVNDRVSMKNTATSAVSKANEELESRFVQVGFHNGRSRDSGRYVAIRVGPKSGEVERGRSSEQSSPEA